jgi:hypothetical protein
MAVTPILTTTFQVATPRTSSLFLFTDTTDYAGYGIALADVTGTVTVRRPDGILLPTGTINPSISLTNNTISIPVDAGGELIEGEYEITYSIVVVGLVEAGTWTADFTADYCNDFPVAEFDWTINCQIAPIVSVSDVTNYTTDEGTWVIGSRTITLYPPPNAPYNTPQSNAGASVNIGNNPVYTGTWSAGLSSVITLTLPSHTVTYTLTHYNNGVMVDSAKTSVVCERFCSIRCCINEAYDRWQTAESNGNMAQAAQYKAQWLTAVGLLSIAVFEAENCNDDGNSNDYIAQIKATLSCNDDCGDCGGDTEGLITPLAGGSAVSYSFVNTTPAYLAISVVGTTVNIGVSAATASILAGVYNYALGLSGSMTTAGFTLLGPVTTGSNPPLRSYTLGFTGTFPDVVDKYSEVVDVAFTGIGSLVTRTDQKVVGGEFQIPTTVDAVDLSALTWAAQPARFNIAGFWVTPPVGVDYKVTATMQYCDYRYANTYLDSVTDYVQSTGDKVADSFNLIVIDGSNGLPLSWGSLNAKYRSISFQFTIQD